MFLNHNKGGEIKLDWARVKKVLIKVGILLVVSLFLPFIGSQVYRLVYWIIKDIKISFFISLWLNISLFLLVFYKLGFWESDL